MRINLFQELAWLNVLSQLAIQHFIREHRILKREQRCDDFTIVVIQQSSEMTSVDVAIQILQDLPVPLSLVN